MEMNGMRVVQLRPAKGNGGAPVSYFVQIPKNQSGAANSGIVLIPSLASRPSKSDHNQISSTAKATSAGNSVVSLNRPSIEAKLSLRPPRVQLVERGILPAWSGAASAGFHEQKRRLQRARTGDMLKRKMEQRPDRQQLLSQHILLADESVDAGIQERQRQLSKCRLADNLNEKLAHRPGPLELVMGNILHVDDQLQEALMDGRLQFKPTSAGEAQKRPLMPIGGDGDLSPGSCSASGQDVTCGDNTQCDQRSGSDLSAALQNQFKPMFKKLKLSTTQQPPSVPPPADGSAQNQQRKIIKFHEYKGPPSVQKVACKVASSSAVADAPPPTDAPPSCGTPGVKESSYDLLLNQQQLFLQWQLELQQQYPNSSIHVHVTAPPPPPPPASVAPDERFVAPSPGWLADATDTAEAPCVHCGKPAVAEPAAVGDEDAVALACKPILRRLADLRVSDLKSECKKRNLPVSGPKPALLERLRPFEEAIISAAQSPEPADSAAAAAAAVPGALPPIEQVVQDYPRLATPGSMAECSSDTSGVASNYSSPGLDLAAMPFAPSPAVVGASQLDSFSFASHGSGGQFTAAALPPRSQLPPPPPPDLPPSAFNQLQQSAAVATDANDCTVDQVMLATTLSIHEEMLRHQQRKIEELQRELQRSQDQLKHQQQVIMAARKAQTSGRSADANNSFKTAQETAADAWLSRIDTKQLQKFHMQLFVQHKLQRQNLQQQVVTQEQLTATHRAHAEEMQTQQALDDLARTLRSDGGAARRLLQLWRERGADAPAACSACAHPCTAASADAPPRSAASCSAASVSEPKQPKPRKSVKSVPSSPVKSRAGSGGGGGTAADMEEVFKAVLEYASRATHGNADRLPSCDKLISPLRTNESAATAAADVDATPAAPDAFAPVASVHDLMETLRSHDSRGSDCLGFLDTHDQYLNGVEFPNTYGCEELNDLLGPHWTSRQPSDRSNALPYDPMTNYANFDVTDGSMQLVEQSAASLDVSDEAAFDGLSASEFVQGFGGGHGGTDTMDWLDLIMPTSPTCPELPLPGHQQLAARPSGAVGPSDPVLAQSVSEHQLSVF